MVLTYVRDTNYVNRSSGSKVIIQKKMKQTLGCCDLALDLVTFRSELDLDMVVTYLQLKIRLIDQAVQKLSSAQKKCN